MSLLQLQTKEGREYDAGAAGEDYAKGSSHPFWAILTAAVVLCAAVWVFVLLVRKPPVAAGEVTQVWAHAVHTLSTPTDAAGVQGPGMQFDQELVFASIRIRNQSDKPIVLKEVQTNLVFPDGPHFSIAATNTDFGRIFVAYPELSGLHGKSLLRDQIIQPGQVADGMIVSSFHVTREAWAAHKDLSFTVQFAYHPDLTLTPTTATIEQ